LNIILKRKNQGLNGTFIASTGYPGTYGLSGNLNYKTAKNELLHYHWLQLPDNQVEEEQILSILH
jgi:hypothetical protein